jgi:hypothetical protein
MVVSYLKLLHTPSYQYRYIIATIIDIHALFKPLVYMIVITLCIASCVFYISIFRIFHYASVYLNFLFCIPEDGHKFGPKNVGICMYKLILMYAFARRKPEITHVCICWYHCCIQVWRRDKWKRNR